MRGEAVIDWKSDVNVTPTVRAGYVHQLQQYLSATGASRGALVLDRSRPDNPDATLSGTTRPSSAILSPRGRLVCMVSPETVLEPPAALALR
jgi:hypothetical protein